MIDRTALLLAAALVLPIAVTAEEDAAALYATECAFCHGAKGGGDGQAAGMLKPKPTAFSNPAYWKTTDRAALAEIIANGKAGTGMMSFSGRLTPDQIKSLIAYLETLSR